MGWRNIDVEKRQAQFFKNYGLCVMEFTFEGNLT